MWGGDGLNESQDEYQVIVCSFDDKFVALEDSDAFVANPGGCCRELCSGARIFPSVLECGNFLCLRETPCSVISVPVSALLWP